MNTLFCPECGTQNLISSNFCTSCGYDLKLIPERNLVVLNNEKTDKPKSNKGTKLSTPNTKKRSSTKEVLRGIVGFIFLLLLIGLIESSFSGSEESEKDNVFEDLKSSACFYAQEAVKEQLVSPGSAEFPFLPNGVAHLGNNHFKVWGYVDSQNRLGVLIRTNWIVKLKYNGGDELEGDSWEIEDIKLYE